MKGEEHIKAGEGASFWQRLGGDVSGAFADLGTFLPLLVGMFAVTALDPSGVLIGFGLFALATALIYRRPVPVQPMKAVAALVIGGGLGAGGVAASGLLISLILCLFAAFGVVGRLGRLLPNTVLAGIQLGIGLILAWSGIQLMGSQPLLGLAALAFLLALQFTRFKPLAGLAVIVAAAVVHTAQPGNDLPALLPGLYLPQLQLPAVAELWQAAGEVLLPQLTLTLTNATLITAAIAARYFPADRARITPDRLALSTGVFNLLLAPFGAFPMCHGAGGLVVQHRFGARTGLAPALFGSSCLALGLFLGPNAIALLAAVPLAAVGSLLLLAGVDLAKTERLLDSSADKLWVIVPTGLACLLLNVAAGLLLGFALEGLRRWRRGQAGSA